MRIWKTTVILGVVAAAFFSGRWYGGRSTAPAADKGGRKILYYVDPMHPAYKSDKPGVAPDCGMRLEPVYEDQAQGAPAAERKVLYYRDPQDPNYTSRNPGLNPETGRELEPVYAEEPSSLPPGVFQVSSERQQLIGVRYGMAEIASASRTIRAVGKVEMDETRIARIHPKVDGWIETVFVDFTGKFVKKGQPLLTIYSPELLATQQEYLLALKAVEVMKHSSMPDALADNHSLVEAARRRLELWDLTPEQIDEIRATQKPVKTVTLHSPASGYVKARNAFPRQRVMPETELYTVVDLSRVWVVADVFEYEAPSIRPGMPAAVSLSYSPGKTIPARVSYIQPSVDPMTRTLKVRLELANPGLILKPEMFVNVEFRVGGAPRVMVPLDAVLDSGERKTVFVDRGNGRLEPRHVRTGEQAGDRVEILAGLDPGERIVISGTFLIDSESQLKAAASGMASHPHGGTGAPAKADPSGKPAAPSGAHQHD
jgi:RND family efflux transporter MFP subunit